MPDGTREQILTNLVESSLRAIAESHKNQINTIFSETMDTVVLKFEKKLQEIVQTQEDKTEVKEKSKENNILIALMGVIIFLVVAVVAFVGIRLTMPNQIPLPSPPAEHR